MALDTDKLEHRRESPSSVSENGHPTELDADNQKAGVCRRSGDNLQSGACDHVEESDTKGEENHGETPQEKVAPLPRLGDALVVPRSQRRGLFGRFTIIPEVDQSYKYKAKTKWTITVIVALAAGTAPIGSAIIFPALPQLTTEFQASATIINLTVALYMLATGIFPLWWSFFSETLGRRTIYLISFTLFTVLSALCAVSVNIGMLVVMRILGGSAAASVQAVGAGTIADIWQPAERGKAMGIFYLGPLLGPLLAPIVGGGIAQGFGWRGTMWFLTIFGGTVLFLIFFCLPETLAINQIPAVPTRTPTAQSDKIDTKKLTTLFKRFVIGPPLVLLYLRFPPVLVTVYSAAIAFGTLFLLNISIQSAFSKQPYAFPEIVVGLLYLPISIGSLIASMLGGQWVDKIMVREAQKAGRYDNDGELIFLPEDRMRENMWLAATLYPGAIIWYGWAVERHVHWVVPSIATSFFGLASVLVFSTVTTMLTEFMPRRSSSGVAINNFIRNVFSCIGSVAAQPLIDAMGNGWMCTMVGLFACITGNIALWLLKRNSQKWRISMDKRLNTTAA